MRFTTAQLFITESHVELDGLQGYRAYGIPSLFNYTNMKLSAVQERTPVRDTDRTAYLTFDDGSVAVVARCKHADNDQPTTWKAAEARTEGDNKPKPPADPDGPEWLWIGGQAKADAWIREIEKTLVTVVKKVDFSHKTNFNLS